MSEFDDAIAIARPAGHRDKEIDPS